MKFEEAQKYSNTKDELLDIKRRNQKPDEHVKTTKLSNFIDDPDEYPTEDMYAWDTGIADRSPVGFTSDINVLRHKEMTGGAKGEEGEEEEYIYHSHRIIKGKK